MIARRFTHRLRSLAVASAALAAALVLPNCASRPKAVSGGLYSIHFDPPATRPVNPSNVSIKISTGPQRLYVMEGNKVLLATPCSVGKPGAVTPPGNHRVGAKVARRRSHSYGNYPMPNWLEFAGDPAYGIHWGFIKPYPCTHGCVRLPKWAAAKVFAMVPSGAPIHVAVSHPEDATAGRNLPRLDDTTLPDPPASYMQSDQVFQDAVYKGRMFVN